MKTAFKLFGTLMMASFLALSLSACGKKSNPKAPSEESKFPSQYPSE